MKYSSIILLSAMLLSVTACSNRKPAVHLTDEPFRSVYHHTPEANWMNDPNGMFYDEANGVWHLYYQHNPFGTTWGPMHWGHATSTDLLTWEEHPIVLYPDSIGTIFSGSAVIDKNNTAGFGENAIVAIFTQSERIGQHQSIAYSTDGGYTFTKYEGNPVLMGDIADFRDPKVTWDGDHWLMTLACQQEIRFYASPDLKNWEYLSSFGKDLGAHGGVWECPELIKLKMTNDQMVNKFVLLVSINPGGPFGGSATQYFVGDWDGRTFSVCQRSDLSAERSNSANGLSGVAGHEVNWLDYGKDNYSTFTFHNSPDGRLVAIGWMSNWQYAEVVPTVAFRSQNTIARDLFLFTDDEGEFRLGSVPSLESMALRGEETRYLPDAGIVELELDGKQDALITLSNDKGEKVVMNLDVHRRTFSMDRTASGDCSFSHDFAARTVAPLFIKRDTYKVLLFIDHCSIEAFDAEGAWSMTNLVFPSEPYNHLDVQGGEAKIYNVKI